MYLNQNIIIWKEKMILKSTSEELLRVFVIHNSPNQCKVNSTTCLKMHVEYIWHAMTLPFINRFTHLLDHPSDYSCICSFIWDSQLLKMVHAHIHYYSIVSVPSNLLSHGLRYVYKAVEHCFKFQVMCNLTRFAISFFVSQREAWDGYKLDQSSGYI